MSQKDVEKTVPSVDMESSDASIEPLFHKDMSALEGNDGILTEKMFLVNNALDEIGFTWFHMKIFVIAGFGYVADSLIGMAQSTVLTYVNYQFAQTYPTVVQAQYAGLLVGCVFWTATSDIIGRKLAFNITLLLAAIFGIAVGAMSSLATYCIMLVLCCFCLGGNLALDATVFLEFLPSKWQLLTTVFACWWSIGQCIGYLVAYAFYTQPKYYCTSIEDCPSSKNRGWRYVWYIDSGIVLFFALGRLFIKLDETPKYLVTNNKDEEVVEMLQGIATKYGRSCSLTVEQLRACGTIEKNDFVQKKATLGSFISTARKNFAALFSSNIMIRNVALLAVAWFGIGTAYPLWAQFLPTYLAARSTASLYGDTVTETYTDALISTSLSIFGPLLGGGLIMIPRVGRRGTLFIGAILSMIFFMAYTTVKNRVQNVVFTTVSYITVYIYYGCLYGFTPESLPAYCRGTGSGFVIFWNRIGGLIVPVIAHYADPTTSVPIWVCSAFFGVMGISALFFPFEPSLQRTV